MEDGGQLQGLEMKRKSNRGFTKELHENLVLILHKNTCKPKLQDLYNNNNNHKQQISA